MLVGAIDGALAPFVPVLPLGEALLLLARHEEVRAVLPPSVFAEAHERGMSMSYDDVVLYLLDELNAVT